MPATIPTDSVFTKWESEVPFTLESSSEQGIAWTCIGHINNVAEATNRFLASQAQGSAVESEWLKDASENEFVRSGTVLVNTTSDVLLPARPGNWTAYSIFNNVSGGLCAVLFCHNEFVASAESAASLLRGLEAVGGGIGANIPSEKARELNIRFIGRYDWDYYRQFPEKAEEASALHIPWPERDTYEPFLGPTAIMVTPTVALEQLLPWYAVVLDDPEEKHKYDKHWKEENFEGAVKKGIAMIGNEQGAIAHFAHAEYMFGRVWFEEAGGERVGGAGPRAQALLVFTYDMPDFFAQTSVCGKDVCPLPPGFPSSEELSDGQIQQACSLLPPSYLSQMVYDFMGKNDVAALKRLLPCIPPGFNVPSNSDVRSAVRREGKSIDSAMVVLQHAQQSGRLQKMLQDHEELVHKVEQREEQLSSKFVFEMSLLMQAKDVRIVNFLMDCGARPSRHVTSFWNADSTRRKLVVAPFLGCGVHVTPVSVLETILSRLDPHEATRLVNESVLDRDNKPRTPHFSPVITLVVGDLAKTKLYIMKGATTDFVEPQPLMRYWVLWAFKELQQVAWKGNTKQHFTSPSAAEKQLLIPGTAEGAANSEEEEEVSAVDRFLSDLNNTVTTLASELGVPMLSKEEIDRCLGDLQRENPGISQHVTAEQLQTCKNIFEKKTV